MTWTYNFEVNQLCANWKQYVDFWLTEKVFHGKLLQVSHCRLLNWYMMKTEVNFIYECQSLYISALHRNYSELYF